MKGKLMKTVFGMLVEGVFEEGYTGSIELCVPSPKSDCLFMRFGHQAKGVRLASFCEFVPNE